MPHKKFHFQSLDNDWVLREYKEYIATGEVVACWPKSSYSRDKALNRAHRYVGEAVLRSEEGTQFTYSQAMPGTPT